MQRLQFNWILMSQTLTDYYEALDRLRTGESVRVPNGTLITNNAVSLEAGRGAGSIKKSRDVFADLIVAIDEAAVEQSKGKVKLKDNLSKAQTSAKDYRKLWEDGLQREMSLLREIMELKQKLASLTGSKVIPLRPSSVVKG